MRSVRRCTRCSRPVLWTVTEAGHRLAVDAQPNPDGNCAVYCDGTGTWRSRRPTDELPAEGYERIHTPHVATCKGLQLPVTAPAGLPEGVADIAAYRRRSRGRR